MRAILACGCWRVKAAPNRWMCPLSDPRFSPDGHKVAFAAISLLSPIGRAPGFASWFGFLGARAMAHGFPWEVWVVQADGSGLRQISDILDDDPSVAWSPDGTQLLVYGGWGSYVVDASTAAAASLSFLAGYGSIAWLPE